MMTTGIKTPLYILHIVASYPQLKNISCINANCTSPGVPEFTPATVTRCTLFFFFLKSGHVVEPPSIHGTYMRLLRRHEYP